MERAVRRAIAAPVRRVRDTERANPPGLASARAPRSCRSAPAAIGRDALGRTALHIAAEQGQPEIARLLLERGADVHLETQGRTALDLTFESRSGRGARAVATLLRRAGARESLLSAVWGQKPKLVRTILESRPGPWGAAATSAVCVAVALTSIATKLVPSETKYRTRLAIVRLLLEHGADPNGPVPEGSWSPLAQAAQGCSPELVEFLLAAGADPRKPEPDGTLPVEFARNDPAVRELLERAMTAN